MSLYKPTRSQNGLPLAQRFLIIVMILLIKGAHFFHWLFLSADKGECHIVKCAAFLCRV